MLQYQCTPGAGVCDIDQARRRWGARRSSQAPISQLDISIAPDFDDNGAGDDYFYWYYTPAALQRARLARFTQQENGGGLTSRDNLSSEFLVWEDTDGDISCCH